MPHKSTVTHNRTIWLEVDKAPRGSALPDSVRNAKKGTLRSLVPVPVPKLPLESVSLVPDGGGSQALAAPLPTARD